MDWWKGSGKPVMVRPQEMVDALLEDLEEAAAHRMELLLRAMEAGLSTADFQNMEEVRWLERRVRKDERLLRQYRLAQESGVALMAEILE